jgi:hypothetical protein
LTIEVKKKFANVIVAGALFLFSSWYTKKELAARISILYVAAQISGAFGGLLGSAIMSGMNGKAGLPAWRWLCMRNDSPMDLTLWASNLT